MKIRSAVVTALLCAAAAVSHAAPARLSEADARHLLLRTGFAPTQAEVDRIVGRDAKQVVGEMIAQARAARPVQPPPELAPAERRPQTQEERMAFRQGQNRSGQELKRWWMAEMVATPTPLAERMTLFWHNHFATSQQKVVLAQAMWNQQQLFRQQALGNFRVLLHGVARDPAMLVWLDGAGNRKEAPNENFAREVMELFTLGEGDGYTEQDIREAARAFTGLSIDRDDFQFRFRPMLHDTGDKTLFGRTGNFDGDAVIDILLEQPAAARFVTGKLWREFVSPTPDAKEVERIGRDFRASGWDIGVALRDLLLSDAFWAEANRGSLVKSPVELVVGAARQLEVPLANTMPLVQKSAQLGQNLLLPPNVKGWPGYTTWINATTLMERKRFAEQVLRVPQFDPANFLALYGVHPDREPDAAAQLKLTHAMLPLPPTQTVPSGTVGTGWLRALMSDPAYQLK